MLKSMWDELHVTQEAPYLVVSSNPTRRPEQLSFPLRSRHCGTFVAPLRWRSTSPEEGAKSRYLSVMLRCQHLTVILFSSNNMTPSTRHSLCNHEFEWVRKHFEVFSCLLLLLYFTIMMWFLKALLAQREKAIVWHRCLELRPNRSPQL